MTRQVKVFFIFIAIMAVISVFSFFDIFRGVRSALLNEELEQLPPLDITMDADQDGLSDADESYWNTDFQNPDTDKDGFLDGEEVASGRDPREPAGDDNLNDTVFGTVKMVNPGDFEETNLTDNLNSLLLGGLAAGDLTRTADPDTREKGINALAVSTIDDFYKSFPVFAPALNVIESSEQNQLKYLESLGTIIKNDLFVFRGELNTAQNPFNQSGYFLEKAAYFKRSRDNTSLLNVPSNWVETHNKIVDLFNRFYLNHNAIADYDKDAIKAIIAFNDVENLNSSVSDILKEVQDNIKANNLKPGGVVFEVLDTLLDIQ